MIRSAHERLRAATRANHDRLETRVDILSRLAASGGRRDLVVRFRRLHAEAEPALAPWLSKVPGLDFDGRRRTRWLDADLAELGEQPAGVVRPVTVASVGEALGRMYVLEGSTLGGRVIRRALVGRAQGLAGLSFLDPYGDEAGPRWRSFLAVLEEHAESRAAEDEMVAGAVAGFAHAELTLCGEHVDV